MAQKQEKLAKWPLPPPPPLKRMPSHRLCTVGAFCKWWDQNLSMNIRYFVEWCYENMHAWGQRHTDRDTQLGCWHWKTPVHMQTHTHTCRRTLQNTLHCFSPLRLLGAVVKQSSLRHKYLTLSVLESVYIFILLLNYTDIFLHIEYMCDSFSYLAD